MIVRRYLVREIVVPVLVVTVILLTIFASHRVALLLADALSTGLSGRIIFLLLALKLVYSLDIILPIALYLGTLIAFGRLYSDREMTAFEACGVPERRIVGTVLLVAGVFALGIGGLSLYVKPWAAQLGEHVREQAESLVDVSGVSPGRFHELTGGRGVIYVARLGPEARRLKDVFIDSRRRGTDQVYLARTGHLHFDAGTGRRTIVLENGYRYDSGPAGSAYRVVRFRRLTAWLRRSSANERVRQRSAMSTTGLLASSDPRDRAELEWRLSMPVATLILALLAVPLSRMNPRQGRYARVFMAILVYAVYYNLLGVAKSWVERGKLAPVPGLWLVHALMLCVAIGMLVWPSVALRLRWVRAMR